jgi:hypothetical protein
MRGEAKTSPLNFKRFFKMRKVYKINGKTEVHEVFSSPSGKTKVKVTFTKGNLDPKNKIPARFSTDNPVVQSMIENSPKFNHSIFLEKVYGEEKPIAAPAPKKAAAPAAPAPKKAKAEKKTDAPAERVMDDVKTVSEAVSVLVAEGALASDIDNTVEGALNVAKTLGISFPNLK